MHPSVTFLSGLMGIFLVMWVRESIRNRQAANKERTEALTSSEL